MGSVSAKLKVGRYALYGEIARGGMASVHFGRLLGSAGFSRTVAIKRLHPHFAKDSEFVNMFLDESRLAGRIHHPNVVQTLDAVLLDGELFLVMEYLDGESLARLAKMARDRGENVPLRVAASVLCGALHGLHAAHEATNEQGVRLDVVHRDVSPHNILVGADGVPRVIDFGVARAVGRLQMTMEGQIKGKVAYMSPEQLLGQVVDPRTDVYAAGAVLWELLTGKRLFDAETHAAIIAAVLTRRIPPPSEVVPGTPKALSDVVMRALARTPEGRFATAKEMALAIEACVPLASATQVGAWVTRLEGEGARKRAQTVHAIENDSAAGRWPTTSAIRPTREASPTTDADDADEAEVPSVDRPPTLSQSGTLSRGSSISVLPDAPPSVRSTERRVGAWIGGGATLLVTIVAVAAMRTRGNAASLPEPPVPARAAVELPPVATPSAMTTGAASIPDAAAPSVRPKDEAPSASAVVASPRPPSPVRASHDSPKSRPCSVTTYIDDDGFTHFAKECR